MYTVVLEEDRMTIEGTNQAINYSYNAEITQIVLFPESCYGTVSITCSETGETLHDVYFQIGEIDGEEGYANDLCFGIQAYFDEASDISISAIKNN